MIVILEPKDISSYGTIKDDISRISDYVVYADEVEGGYRFVKNRDGSTDFLTNEQFFRFCQPSLKKTSLEKEETYDFE